MLAAVIKTKKQNKKTNKTKSKDEDLNQNREAVDVVWCKARLAIPAHHPHTNTD